MKKTIKLTKKEREYLADKTFWDWKYAEVDVQCINLLSIPKKRAKYLKTEEQWYKSLYYKLKGEKWTKKQQGEN